MKQLFPNVIKYWEKFPEATGETLAMFFGSIFFIALFGIVIGVLLATMRPGGLLEQRVFYSLLSKVVNFFRAIPFVILIALALPFTRLVVGTAIGVRGAIVPIVVGMVPFVSRQVEQVLLQVDGRLVDMARTLGLGKGYIIVKVLLNEGRAGIVRVLTICSISLIGHTAMAGAVGGGGLGALAIQYGYSRSMTDMTIACVAILLVFVFLLQWIGNTVAQAIEH